MTVRRRTRKQGRGSKAWEPGVAVACWALLGLAFIVFGLTNLAAS
jgi:hypothetical protein